MLRQIIPVLALCLLLTGCAEILYLPPASWFYFPIAEVSSDSIDPQDYDTLADGNEDVLQSLSVGVLRNNSRTTWSSRVEGEILDERIDENVLLAEFLQDEEIFGQVDLIDSIQDSNHDFIITCSVDCLYNIDLDGWMYVMNCITLGIGSIIGWPHHNSSAFYVGESIVYDNRGEEATVVTGTMALNYKEWYCDNIYWRPGFYDDYALEPLFEQMLYEMIANGGCLSG